jgi:hypothetical protein
MRIPALSLALAVLLSSAALQAQQAPQPASQPGKFFDTVDTNKDGVLTQQEWKASGRDPRGFAMMDANSDGKVTRAEGQAFMAKMMAARGQTAN